MQVNLAGYNIDSSLIKRLNTETATPEVISAAYARISRSPKSVTELREEALMELEKARKSNRNIIFELGHASVAEHAVFNFDIIGISRLLTETLETVRFASFTEKSQRYVTFQNDYVVPSELNEPRHESLKGAYIKLMDSLFNEYRESFEALVKFHERETPGLSKLERECRAKEDARYILPLAAKTQLGMTINARSLENLLRRLAANPLQEAAELHAALLNLSQEVCPSLVRYTKKDSFSGTFSAQGINPGGDDFQDDENVRVVSLTPDPDDLILAALLFEQAQADMAHCRDTIADMDFDAKRELWRQVFAGIKPWHKMSRAFELVDLVFELNMSESCWAQFKRHRVGTLIKQTNPSIGPFTLPEEIFDLGREPQWGQLLERLEKFRPKLRQVFPDLSAYIRVNSDKVKVLAKMNLRELYHFVRLRSDEHAQWEIRALSDWMANHLHVLCPNAAALLCGKSELSGEL
ncbi:MAG: FAD-dependent thymidylate synthase [Candidatus Syntrophosphaera sp.]|nr:FAD-dependent thymidylate synthase [Candidatus Syntrophosphaera sp.]